MTALLIAYVVVAFICMAWVTLSEFVKHGSYPEEMEEVYTVVGFGFLWPVSIAWELYCEHKYPIGYDAGPPKEDVKTKLAGEGLACPVCGDLRVVKHGDKWLDMSASEPDEASIKDCPGCRSKLP